MVVDDHRKTVISELNTCLRRPPVNKAKREGHPTGVVDEAGGVLYCFKRLRTALE